MTLEELASNYPLLYHMAARDSWQSIRARGLLSTSALLDLFDVKGKRREAIEREHRPSTILLESPTIGRAVIRDQSPMSDAGLERALQDGLTPREWYEILNAKVYFWTNESRLNRLLGARAYRNDEHDVLIVKTASLLEKYAERVVLSPINSGCTKPFPHPRGRGTFLKSEQYPWDDWKRRRGIADAVVEVAFEGGIPEVAEHVERVVRMKTGTVVATIFQR